MKYKQEKQKYYAVQKTGKIDKYEIEIKKIYKDNNYDNRSMRIKNNR